MATTLRTAALAGSAFAVCTLAPMPAWAQGDASRFQPPAYQGLLEHIPYAEARNDCDEERFLETKQRLLAAFERTVAANPGDARMREDLLRLQSELLPDPCPPERHESVAGATWQPIRDIRFRGNERRATRAPAVGELFAGGRSIDVGESGIGVTRDGPVGSAPDRAVVRTRPSMFLIAAGGMLHLGRLTLVADYEQGTAARSLEQAPVAGGFNGAVFGGLSPSGSTGIGSGSASLSGRINTEVSRFKLGADYEILAPQPRMRFFLGVDYMRSSIDHRMSLEGSVVFPTTTVTFEQSREQRLVDTIYAAGVGAETLVPLTTPDPDGAGLSLRLNAVAQAYLLDTHFASHERNLSNFGPASDSDFTLAFVHDDQTLGFHARGQANLEYVVSPRVALYAGGTAEWFSDAAVVVNPSSGTAVQDGATTRVERIERWGFGGVLGARFRF